MLESKIEQDLKAALLARDAERVSVLRGIKSVLLNLKVAEGKRDSGLNDDEVQAVLAKEAKKRQESADLYKQGGRPEKAEAELAEKVIIEDYLPEQLSEEELTKLIEEAIAAVGAKEPKDMGKVIGMVRSRAGAGADGTLIARLAKEKLGA
jgi:uncharacterized protein YqeY